MKFQLDGKDTYTQLNSTNPVDESNLAFGSETMEDGDHQLLGSIESLQQNGSITLDYFECVVPCMLLYPVPSSYV
jgi:hypothetical protein